MSCCETPPNETLNKTLPAKLCCKSTRSYPYCLQIEKTEVDREPAHAEQSTSHANSVALAATNTMRLAAEVQPAPGPHEVRGSCIPAAWARSKD